MQGKIEVLEVTAPGDGAGAAVRARSTSRSRGSDGGRRLVARRARRRGRRRRRRSRTWSSSGPAASSTPRRATRRGPRSPPSGPDLPGAEHERVLRDARRARPAPRVRAAPARGARRRRPRARRHDHAAAARRSQTVVRAAHAAADGDRPGAQRLHDLHADAGRAPRDRRVAAVRARSRAWSPTGSRCCARSRGPTASCARSRRPGDLNGDWWLGAARPAPARARRRGTCRRGSAGEAVEDIAAFAQSRIESLYERVAARDGRDGAPTSRRSCATTSSPTSRGSCIPAAREVVLVRDPRDVLCSVLASNAKRGERPPPADPLRWIGEVFQGRIAAVAESWERRRDRAHLVRYEDLMLEPGADAHRRARIPRARRRRATRWGRCWRAPSASLPGMSRAPHDPRRRRPRSGATRATSTRPCWRSASAGWATRSPCSATRRVDRTGPDRCSVDAAFRLVRQGYRWRGGRIFRRPRFLFCAPCNESSPEDMRSVTCRTWRPTSARPCAAWRP